MAALSIIHARSPNRSSRHGAAIDCVVLHTTEGAANGAVAWLQDPASKASAHYLIAADGRIYQLVDESEEAWHAGNPAVNRSSIGIELEGKASEEATFTAPMMSSLLGMLRYLLGRYHIPADRQHVFGHCDVPDPDHPGQLGGHRHHTDPGAFFPWNQLFSALNPAPAGTPAGKETPA
jgi:N-acetyl-anhydromuramyl-L-alanine amidase AmpD